MSSDNFRSNISSLGQISKRENLIAKLILRQHKLDLMSHFTEITSGNPEVNPKRDSITVRSFSFHKQKK